MGKVLRPAALAGALGLAALVITACGGGDDSDPSPTPASATAEERAAAEPILKAASLPGEDLPQGFTFQEDRLLTNEESAEEELHYAGAPTVEDLNRWGQILEYEVSYQREIPQTLTGTTLSLQVTTALYRDSAGAEENFEFVRQQTSDPEYVSAQEQESSEEGEPIRDVSISPISFPGVGDSRMAFELTFTTYAPRFERDLDLVAQLIAIRRGRAIGVIETLAVGSPHPLEEVEDIVRTLDERMKDALK